MDCISVYKCLCDETRLRILNLLQRGPLCVCHLQEILGEPQPKMSKQLHYMKRHGLVESRRRGNWTIYQIPENPNPLLAENLKCLQDLAFQDSVFVKDRKRLEKTDVSAACVPAAGKTGSPCC